MGVFDKIEGVDSEVFALLQKLKDPATHPRRGAFKTTRRRSNF